MATKMDVEHKEAISNVMILTDPEGAPLGAPIDLPQNAGPQQLRQMVNKLLNKMEKPYPQLYQATGSKHSTTIFWLQKCRKELESQLQIQPQDSERGSPQRPGFPAKDEAGKV
ncbi:hypothetical protein SDJN03_00229, partial [Cucurbita argyrosperma subsp. sororia]